MIPNEVKYANNPPLQRIALDLFNCDCLLRFDVIDELPDVILLDVLNFLDILLVGFKFGPVVVILFEGLILFVVGPIGCFFTVAVLFICFDISVCSEPLDSLLLELTVDTILG